MHSSPMRCQSDPIGEISGATPASSKVDTGTHHQLPNSELLLLRWQIYKADILRMLELVVPDGYVSLRRQPRLLAEPCARTNLLREASH